MRNWDLKNGDPLNLVISSDIRLRKPDYINDHIWEFFINKEQPAVVTQTTYGLRAHWMKIFPRLFLLPSKEMLKIKLPPVLKAFFPNYLKFVVMFEPDIEYQAEYWVSSSQSLCGRITLTNHNISTKNIGIEIVCNLNSMSSGQGMVPVQMNNGIYSLQGACSDLNPVFALNLNARPLTNPYPALYSEIELIPDHPKQISWVLASFHDKKDSTGYIQQNISLIGDNIISRIEMINQSSTLEIFTGDSDWDAAFALSQKTAYGLIFDGEPAFPGSSFVVNRQPDQGFSIRGDGSDYSYQWNGQSPLDLYYLANILLPGGTTYCEQFLQNYFSSQQSDGFIDWRPGMGGQRSHYLTTPILSTLALQIDQYKESNDWLKEIYPSLMRYIKMWFNVEHDRNLDGIPEWDNPYQSGLTDSPLYSLWDADTQGVNISTLDSPSLMAFLYRECQSLLEIGNKIGISDDAEWLTSTSRTLKLRLENCWDKNVNSFLYNDFQNSPKYPIHELIQFQGNNSYKIRKKLPAPSRLQIRLRLKDEITRSFSMIITGKVGGETINEKLSYKNFYWGNKRGYYTSDKLFESVNAVEISGLNTDDDGSLETVDYSLQDCSLLLPLWANMVSPERAREMIEKNIFPQYLSDYGIQVSPTNASNDKLSSSSNKSNIHSLWNLLIAEGMVNYEDQSSAARVVTHMMTPIIKNLKEQQSFFSIYDAESGTGSGDKNSLHGLAPIGLFLKTLGIIKMTSKTVILSGINPFPWPVTVKYKGTTVTRHTNDSLVTFSTGQRITVSGIELKQISI